MAGTPLAIAVAIARAAMTKTVDCIASILDDLELTCEFPIGDRLAELALLRLARRRVVLDERVAEQRARRLRGLQALRRIPQCARQLPLLGVIAGVGIALDRRIGLDPVLDAPQARADRGRERNMRIDVG